MSDGYAGLKDRLDAAPRGPAPGDDYPRWPGAPEDGPTYFVCALCGEPSTLVYRCSECGYSGEFGGDA